MGYPFYSLATHMEFPINIPYIPLTDIKYQWHKDFQSPTHNHLQGPGLISGLLSRHGCGLGQNGLGQKNVAGLGSSAQ